MTAMNIEVPPHYPIVASELTGLMNSIGEGLLHRPQWRMVREISSKFSPNSKRRFSLLQALSDNVLAPGMSSSEGQLDKVVEAMADPAASMTPQEC